MQSQYILGAVVCPFFILVRKMSNVPFDCRYSKILEKNPREIVLLRGNGCKWRRCRFCDYHTDFSLDEQANFQLNSKVLAQVTGEFGRLEVINSGSFCDLNDATISLLLDLCVTQKITTLYFECHWMHRELIADFKKKFTDAGITVKMKIGVEIFKREVYPLYKDNEQVDILLNNTDFGVGV